MSEQWLIWCGTDLEQAALARAFGAECVSIYGSLSPDEKVRREAEWREGRVRVLITKPEIMGWGVNWQHCARMIFVGLSDSYEAYFQCLRRCWRFGQEREVKAWIVLSDAEQTIYDNVLGKEREAAKMCEELVAHAAEFERLELTQDSARAPYAVDEASGENWRLLLGDSAERLAELPAASVDLSLYSPPFSALYTYSATERDLGNARDDEEFFAHYRYVSTEIRRVMRPGRMVCVHSMDLPMTRATHGVIGLRDFSGALIAHHVSQGFIYHGRVTLDRDPQGVACRNKTQSLMFATLRRDQVWLSPVYPGYVLLFRAPGENAVPIRDAAVTQDTWIRWARCVWPGESEVSPERLVAPAWYGIRDTRTLNVAVARDQPDERHVCPLDLDTIERCVRLYSNPGELVLSPFAGIGSEGVGAIGAGRRFLGLELKPSYFKVASANLREAERQAHEPTLFDFETSGFMAEDESEADPSASLPAAARTLPEPPE